MASNLRVDSIVPSTGANVSIGTATGGVNIPGTLTYEDVTNVDSVGVITARSGIRVGANGTKRETVHLDVGDSDANYLRFTNTTTGNGVADGFNVGINADENALLWNFENKNTIFATNNLERFRITSAGKVAIGTTLIGHDDADNLTIDGSGEGTGRTGLTIRSATNTFGSIFFSDATSGAGQYDGVVAYDHSTQTMRFSTASTQRVYINSDGVVSLNSTYAGSTTNGSPIMLINPRVTGSNTMGIKFQARADVYNVTHIQFEHAVNQQVMGNITSANAGATSYNTSSDYRLKENVSSITDGISRVKQLLPKKFNFIIDETNTLRDGFLAHEVS